MTNKELFELVKSGTKPLVRVVNESNIEEGIFDDGMIGRVEYAELDSTDEKYGTVYVFGIREDEFRLLNKDSMKCNYYDKQKSPTLNYIEAGYAPKNGIERTWVMDYDTTFELADDNILLKEYIEKKVDKPYVTWLEEKALSLMNNK
jgi:hypothetical protein